MGSVLTRQEGLKDPLHKDGGSEVVIKQERQAIADLLKRHVAIRIAIQRSNHETIIVIGNESRTVAEWLTWRKEIAPGAQAFVTKMRSMIQTTRARAQQKGIAVVAVSQTPEKLTDLLVNVDEGALTREAESFETTLGTLDGLLSLKNATC